MSDPRSQGAGHPDLETLAAYIDQRLSAEDRAAIERHLADCDACREVWVEAGDAMEAMTIAAAVDVPTRRVAADRPSNWRRVAAMAAGAAALLLVGLWLVFRPAPLDEPIAALATSAASSRWVESRLDGAGWAPRPGAVRGTEASASSAARLAATRLLEAAADRRDAQALHARGLALLALGNVDAAIVALASARDAASDRAASHSDLAAAYFERYRRGGVRDDAEAARREAERAVTIDPRSAAALFNQALAAEALGDIATARQAWDAMLRIDTSSPWAEEARARLAALPR